MGSGMKGLQFKWVLFSCAGLIDLLYCLYPPISAGVSRARATRGAARHARGDNAAAGMQQRHGAGAERV